MATLHQLGFLMLGAALLCAGAQVLAAERRSLIDSLERELQAELDCFYPRTVDRERGGFVAHFENDWSPASAAKQSKHIVFQSRQTWTAAVTAMRRPALADRFIPIARHGADYLMNTMWDREHGGFFWELDLEGRPLGHTEKHGYGQAFAIYALAAAGQATGDDAMIDAAYACFDWLEKHAHDPEHGGYFEQYRRDGSIIHAPRDGEGAGRATGEDLMGIRLGHKSMNTHIHLLEAFTQLYHARPTPRLRERLVEMIAIVRDRMAAEPGFLHWAFTPDWQPLPAPDSYGHDIEAAVLLLEAAEAIGAGDDPRTRAVAKSLVDHPLKVAFDTHRGGLAEEGSITGELVKPGKIWWAQAETIHALAFAIDRFGDPDGRYMAALEKTWQFICDHMIDKQHGGWYLGLPADGTVGPDGSVKSMNWKASYHTARALMNASDALRRAQ